MKETDNDKNNLISNSQTNFEWRRTTQSDVQILNTWNNPVKDDLNPLKHDSITRYITGCNTRLGDYVEGVCENIDKQESELLSKCRCRTATINENIIGIVVVSGEASKNLFGYTILNIEAIITNPSVQKKGYGTAMVFDIVKCKDKIFGYKTNQIKASIAKTNLSSQKIFEKNNFKTYSWANGPIYKTYRLDTSS